MDPQLAQWFNAVDRDRSGQIGAKELQRALVNGNWSHLSEEACRMMIDMFDRDKTGQINVHEFSSLIAYIEELVNIWENIRNVQCSDDMAFHRQRFYVEIIIYH